MIVIIKICCYLRDIVHGALIAFFRLLLVILPDVIQQRHMGIYTYITHGDGMGIIMTIIIIYIYLFHFKRTLRMTDTAKICHVTKYIY